jgi:hypothetical protein
MSADASALVTAFQQLVPASFALQRENNYWVLTESQAPNRRFELAAGRSYGFTLDRPGVDAFPFCSNALKGVKSVNDALIVARVNDEVYVVAVEMKSSKGQIPDAVKQIETGRLFAAWVRQLLSLHGHWHGGACKFFGVVSLKPRSQNRKGSSTRGGVLPAPQTARGGYPYFVLTNQPRTSVEDLIKRAVTQSVSCPAMV